MNLAQQLSDRAANSPGTLAIIEQHGRRVQSTTFAQLQESSQRIARVLIDSGLRPGNSVLVLVPMSCELYSVLAALFQLGLTAVFVDLSAGIRNLDRCCQLQKPDALIATTRGHLLRLLSRNVARAPKKFVLGRYAPGATSLCGTNSPGAYAIIEQVSPDTPALVTFTSGSTGVPKGIVRSHAFLLAQYQALDRCLRFQAADRDLTTMPIVLLTNLASGVTSVIANGDLQFPGSIDPQAIVAQISEQCVTTITAAPAFLDRLSRFCIQRSIVFPQITKVVTGGAPTFPSLLERVRQVTPNAKLLPIYGSSEAEPIASLDFEQISHADRIAMQAGAGLLAGHPVPDVEFAIIEDRWGQVLGPLSIEAWLALVRPTNVPGEIVVSGKHVLTDYLHGQGNSEFKIRVGLTTWHRTGDAGYLDAHGRLWLLGRCQARIQDAWGSLYPFAVETAASDDSRIRIAAVVKCKGKRTLVVEPTSQTNRDLRSDLLRQFKDLHIEDVMTVRKIPVDARHNSKVDYQQLTRSFASS